jgi:putative component of membrane protein insertase Oxa1/YidC/SpoIIIJ protein YidD
MRLVALAAIRAYQRYVSPYKGFCCAYRTATGRASCSALGYRTVRRHGVVGGVALLRRRMHLCGVAHRRIRQHARPALRRSERGVCDCGCPLPCDAPGCDLPCHAPACDLPCDASCSDWLDGETLCDLSDCCDWPSRKDRHGAEMEQSVHVPFMGSGSRWRRPS